MGKHVKNEKSCGAVIYKRRGPRILYLVAKMNHGHYSLIKGHVEDGESEIMTAHREIKEETNLDVVLDTSFRKTISYAPYIDRPSIIKDVVFFVATPLGGRIKKQDEEVDELMWCSFTKGMSLLTHDSDRGVLSKAHEYIRHLPVVTYEEKDLSHLVLPAEQYLPSYLETKDHHGQGDGFVYPGVPNVLERIHGARLGIGLPAGWVKGTYLWLVIRNEYIGEISIRHELTDALLRFGGNIGYRIRAYRRQQGFGKKMLSLGLAYVKEVLGLKKVLITCDDDNIGSIKVIEGNGGVLYDKIPQAADCEERLTRRYWVDVK